MLHEKLKIKRDTEAIQIPSGTVITIPAGTHITITQALGSSYTVLAEDGYMARINIENADALGKEAEAQAARDAAKAALTEVGDLTPAKLEENVWEQLRTCYDPEIPVNVVELGLVYKNVVQALPDGGYHVDITMTLTAPGCGMGPVLATEIDGKVRALPGVKSAKVEVVFDPAWDQSMMSEAAKLQLGFF